MARELSMSIKGLHVIAKKLATGQTRYYYYAFRGGPKFWTSEGSRLDGASKRLPPEFIQAYSEVMEDERAPVADSLAMAVMLYRKKSPLEPNS